MRKATLEAGKFLEAKHESRCALLDTLETELLLDACPTIARRRAWEL
jgi:hypothetical protein